MLYLQLFEGMALVALTAYIFSHSRTFKNLIKNNISFKDKIIMIIFFRVLSILGTYIGVDIQPRAIANTRPIGAIVAGMMGGPVVGIIVGAIAGTHRYTLGFMDIIKRIKVEYARTGALQAQRVLAISKQTLFYMRMGLNKNTADNIVKIIYEIGIVRGVFIADKKDLLAYWGESLSEILLMNNISSVFSQNSYKVIKFKNNFKDEVFYCVPLVINKNEFEGILGLKVKRI